MTEEEKKLVRAIAVANGHPDPDDYVQLVEKSMDTPAEKDGE